MEKPQVLSNRKTKHHKQYCFLSFTLTALFVFLTGCASTIDELPYKNIVMFDYEGKPVHPCSSTENRGQPEGVCKNVSSAPQIGGYEPINDFPGYLDVMFKSMDNFFTRLNNKKIVIFVHGGLNSRGGTLERVAEDKTWGTPLYQAIKDSGQYPVFINWNSGLLSSYSDHLFNIRQGEDSPLLGAITSPVYLGVDMVRSISRAPMVWTGLAMEDAKTSNLLAPFMDKKPAIEVSTDIYCRNHRGTEPPNHSGLCSKMAPNPEPDGFDLKTGHDKRGIGEIAWAGTQYVVTLPLKVLLAPFVDAIGTSAWNNMLRRVSLLFHIDEEFHVDDKEFPRNDDQRSISYTALKNPKLGLSRVPVSGGVSLFMKEFIKKNCKSIKEDPGEWEITLVGHSMGTIVLNELIRNFGTIPKNQCGNKQPIKMPFKNIVYMASASTIRHYEETVVPYLEKNTGTHFYNLMLGRQAEIRETTFMVSPRGSLLVWIDTFFSNPLTHRDKMLGRFDNFMVTLHDTPEPVKDRIHIKSFNTGWDAEENEPQKHGDFGNLKFWDEQCWQGSPPPGLTCYKQ